MRALTGLLLLLHLRHSLTAPGPGVLSLFYRGALPTALLKYNAGPGWTSPCPGAACVPFAPSANASFPAAQGWQEAGTPPQLAVPPRRRETEWRLA